MSVSLSVSRTLIGLSVLIPTDALSADFTDLFSAVGTYEEIQPSTFFGFRFGDPVPAGAVHTRNLSTRHYYSADQIVDLSNTPFSGLALVEEVGAGLCGFWVHFKEPDTPSGQEEIESFIRKMSDVLAMDHDGAFFAHPKTLEVRKDGDWISGIHWRFPENSTSHFGDIALLSDIMFPDIINEETEDYATIIAQRDETCMGDPFMGD